MLMARYLFPSVLQKGNPFIPNILYIFHNHKSVILYRATPGAFEIVFKNSVVIA